tara:strand:+ start:2839 stop:3075 length:237 start_codon:yes stop_codon:yes gene_type:complete
VNENIFTIGLALFVMLMVVSLATIIISPIAHKDDIEFIKKVERERTNTAWFLFGWLVLVYWVVWISLILPKPRGGKIL